MEASARDGGNITCVAVREDAPTDVAILQPVESSSPNKESRAVVKNRDVYLNCSPVKENVVLVESYALVIDNSKAEESCQCEGTCDKSTEESAIVPLSSDGAQTNESVGFGNDLAVSAEQGLLPLTCLNLEPDTPWDVLSDPSSSDGTSAPFSNGGVLLNNFTPPDMIIENPVSDCNETEDPSLQHEQHKDEMHELSLESLQCQSDRQCEHCNTSRDESDSLGCSCVKMTRIVIDKTSGNSSVLIIHGEKRSPSMGHVSNGKSSDNSEVYANTLFIDMDEVEGDFEGPYMLPHETCDLTDRGRDHKPEVEEVQEVDDSEVEGSKHHVVYVCDEEDLQDFCRICFCGSEDQPLISPCKCTGSMQYIHHDCLMTWLQRTVRQSCELCQQEIPVVRKRRPISKWRLPHSRPTCFFWLLAFIVTLTLNIASIIRDASQQCVTNACIVFYIVEALGAILGLLFSCFFAVRCVRFVKLWMIHNEEWTFDYISSLDSSRIIKPQKSMKKDPTSRIKSADIQMKL